MSQTFNTNDSSASMERAAGQRDRYAHGSVIVANLRSKALQGREQAQAEMKDFTKREMSHSAGLSTGADWAFERMLQWLDDPKCVDATSTREEGIPTS